MVAKRESQQHHRQPKEKGISVDLCKYYTIFVFPLVLDHAQMCAGRFVSVLCALCSAEMENGDGAGRTRRCFCRNAADTAPIMVSESTLPQRKDNMKKQQRNKGKHDAVHVPQRRTWGTGFM